MKNVDKLIFWVCALGVLPFLTYMEGYDRGKAEKLDTCPVQNGKVVAYSERRGETLQCVYIKHFKGIV